MNTIKVQIPPNHVKKENLDALAEYVKNLVMNVLKDGKTVSIQFEVNDYILED